MSARAGLSNLIRRIRGMAQLGTADYSKIMGDGSTVFWWSDSQIQEILDAYRTDYQYAELIPAPEMIAGTLLYKTYYAPDANWEEATSGSAFWLVTDPLGNDAGTANYSANYIKGQIRFNINQAGSAFYLIGNTFNLNATAADIWRQKAAAVANGYDFSTDRQSFKRSQYFDNCLKMAAHFDSEDGISQTQFVRSDLGDGNSGVVGSLRLSDGGIPANGWDN